MEGNSSSSPPENTVRYQRVPREQRGAKDTFYILLVDRDTRIPAGDSVAWINRVRNRSLPRTRLSTKPLP